MSKLTEEKYGETAPMPITVSHEKFDRLPPHQESSHTEHGLTYVVDGWLRMENRSRIEVRAGTISVVPPGVPHRLLGGENVELWLVNFCASCLGLNEAQALMSPFRNVRQGAFPTVAVSEERRDRLVQLYADLEAELRRRQPETPDVTRSLLTLLLSETRRAASAVELEAYEGSLVTDALEFIQGRALDSISLKDVAASVHRTPAHVASEVKKSTGHTVGEWIAAARITEAAARLAHTDDTMDEIVSHIGWRDKTHFIRQFRKARGITPAAWRRQHRLNHQNFSD